MPEIDPSLYDDMTRFRPSRRSWATTGRKEHGSDWGFADSSVGELS
jgi:hypothetical protein